MDVFSIVVTVFRGWHKSTDQHATSHLETAAAHASNHHFELSSTGSINVNPVSHNSHRSARQEVKPATIHYLYCRPAEWRSNPVLNFPNHAPCSLAMQEKNLNFPNQTYITLGQSMKLGKYSHHAMLIVRLLVVGNNNRDFSLSCSIGCSQHHRERSQMLCLLMRQDGILLKIPEMLEQPS